MVIGNPVVNMKEAGFTLLDVLAAMAILGIISVIVWISLNASYNTLVNSREHTWVMMLASSKAVEVHNGAEKAREGYLTLPMSANDGFWKITSKDEQLVLEVLYGDSHNERRLELFVESSYSKGS